MTTRRQWLQGAAAAATFLCMPAIARADDCAPEVDDTGPLRGKELLPPPDFAALAKHVIRVAGVRPHRTCGVRLELMPPVETAKGAKFVIHNYGHSGAGITLSWGCASHVMEHVQSVLDQMRGTSVKPSVAVLGSGVIGLTSATELRRKWPRLPITVYAKTLDVTQTTSFIAGGQFEPSQIWREYQNRPDVLADYLRRSATRIKELQNSGRRQDFGVAQRKNYTLDEPDEAFDCYTPCDVVPRFRRGKLPFKDFNVVGREYSTWLMNPKILLPRLILELKRGGVLFQAKTFGSEQQLHDDLKENIVVNCTGYGAKKLFGDMALKPRRGHLIVLRNPDLLTYFFSGGCENGAISYLFARQHDIVVGGTVIYNDEDEREHFDPTDPNDKAICDRLLDNAALVFSGRSSICVKTPSGHDDNPTCSATAAGARDALIGASSWPSLTADRAVSPPPR